MLKINGEKVQDARSIVFQIKKKISIYLYMHRNKIGRYSILNFQE